MQLNQINLVQLRAREVILPINSDQNFKKCINRKFFLHIISINSPQQGVGQPDGTLAVITLATPVESLSVNSFPFTSCVNKHNRFYNCDCSLTKYDTRYMQKTVKAISSAGFTKL